MRPNERLDSTSMRSDERLNLKGEVIVSFFNELDTGKELCSRFQVSRLLIPRLLFQFLMSLLQRRKLCSKPLFHFLTSLLQRRETMLVTLLDHGFQEDNALEGHHVKGKNSVMASKRSSLDGR
jgi:hypothetical protein